MNRRFPPARRGREAGMTLLEVLVSILLFSFGILGMVALQAKASQFSVDGEDRTRAALFANEIISQMWTRKTTTLPAADRAAWIARIQDPRTGLPGSDGQVSVDAAGVVTVRITWTSPVRDVSQSAGRYETQFAMP